jgi:uncharacterized repeat protein (TIGR03943 family)
MADHAHDHGHTAGEYYLEQLLTVAVSGAFAVVAVLMYTSGKLTLILAPELRAWVLAGGLALMLLTVVRVVVLWRATRPAEHVHGPDCNHAPGHQHTPDCGHSHGPDDAHEHGSFYWRGVVLLFPIAMYFLGMPNESFSQEFRDRMLGGNADLGAIGDVAAKDGEVRMSFADLAAAADDADLRGTYTGQKATLKGQLKPVNDKEFTLYYLKMNCCAADMIPLKARIIADTSITTVTPHKWYEVTGKLQFAPVPGKGNQHIPVLRTTVADIKSSTPE